MCACVHVCVEVTPGLQIIKTLAKSKQLELKFQGISGRQGMQHDYTFHIKMSPAILLIFSSCVNWKYILTHLFIVQKILFFLPCCPPYTIKWQFIYSWFQTFACFQCCILSFGWFPGVGILCADVSKPSVCSIFIGGVSRSLQHLWRWNRVNRKVGTLNSDAGESPKKRIQQFISHLICRYAVKKFLEWWSLSRLRVKTIY